MEIFRFVPGIVLVCAFALWTSPAHAQTDVTRQDGAKGSGVVELVLNTLLEACIYTDYNLFLRSLAYVETRDGNDPATYTTPNYNGGIWKVDEAMFKRTQTEANYLSFQYGNIQNKLRIDWSQVTWADLRKPLYSALAAALFLTLEGAPQNVPLTVSEQGNYWLQHYRQRQTNLTAQNYSVIAENFKHSCSRIEDLDLLFIVDTSSSVGPSEWSATIDFVADIIVSLDLHNSIAPDKDRVAMVTFSTDAKLAFGFNNGSDIRSAMVQLISTPHTSGGTNLSAAFYLAQTEVFNNSRPNAAKVVVVVTDGETSDRERMAQWLMALKMSDVQVFIVGISSSVTDAELKLVGSPPECIHTHHVKSYDQLRAVNLSLEKFSCRVPEVLEPGVHTYPCGVNVLAQISGSAYGSSLTVTTSHGDVEIFGINSTNVPSRDVHEINMTASALAPASIVSNDPRPLTLSVESKQQGGLLCSGNFTILVEDNAVKRTDCNGREPDFVFLLDGTLATTDDQWQAMLRFVQAFLQRYDVMSSPPQVALLTFTENVTTHIDLGPLSGNFTQELANISRPTGLTSNLADALTFVAHHVLGPASGTVRPDASKTVILVTSGRPANPIEAIRQASQLHMLGSRIVVAAVGNSFDDVHLNTIASSRLHVQKVSDVIHLASVASQVLGEACETVAMFCVEGGVSRECLMEDVMGGHCGEILKIFRSVTSDPCAMQITASLPANVRLSRFPHPTDVDKFLLCGSAGHAYVVLCPLGQVYSVQLEECHPAGAPVNITQTSTTRDTTALSTPFTTTSTLTTTTTTTPTTTPTTTIVTTTPEPTTTPLPTPCTPDVINSQQYYQPYPPDRTKFFHCTGVNVGQIESCPTGMVWEQSLVQCRLQWVIVDENTRRTDPSLSNPCMGGVDYFSVPTNQTVYIECNFMYEGFLRHCPTGQVWKSVLTACDYL